MMKRRRVRKSPAVALRAELESTKVKSYHSLGDDSNTTQTNFSSTDGRVRVKRHSDILREGNSSDEDSDDSQDSRTNKVKEVQKHIEDNKFKGRIAIFTLALIMLWTTSFAVCRSLVRSILPSPSLDQVEESIDRIRTTTNNQAEGYEACVNNQFRTCSRTFNRTRDAEIARYEGVLNTNAASLNALSTRKAECSDLNVDISLELQPTVTRPSAHLIANTGLAECTADVVDSASTRQIKAAEAVATAAAADKAAQTAIDDFSNQVDARREYDDEYFGETLPNAVDQMFEEAMADFPSPDSISDGLNLSALQFEACFSGSVTTEDGETVSCPGFSPKNTFSNSINDLQNEIDSYEKLYNSYSIEYDIMVANAKRWRESAKKSGLNIDRSPWNFDQKIKNLANYVPGEIGFDVSAFEEKVAQLQADLERQTATHFVKLAQLNETLFQMQMNFTDSMSADYNPPNFSQSEFQFSLSDRIATDLSFIPNNTVDNNVTEVISNAKESAASLLTAEASREFSFFTYPEQHLIDLKIGLGKISDLAVLFDLVYRVMNSVLLVKKYWNISGINTPPANMQTDDAKVFTPKKNQIQAVVDIISNPVTIMLILVISVVSTLSLIYIAYAPLYNTYTTGCLEYDFTEIPEETDGTMLYRNVFSLSMQYAVRPGDNAVSSNIDTLNVEREFTCQEHFAASSTTRDDQNSSYTDLKLQLETLGAILGPYSSCVNWKAFDAAAGTQVASLIETAVKLSCDDPESLFGDELFPVQLSDQATIYQCADVQQCIHTCQGVEVRTMESVSFDTACTSEWGFHSYFLIGLISFFMYVCLNISRYYIMRGVIATCWRHVSMDMFSYQGSCTEKGTIIYPSEIDQGDMMFHELVKERLEKAMRIFVFRGWLEIVLAFCMNLPWVVFLVIVAPDLKYETLQDS